MIQFINVSKHYPAHQALKDVSLTIPDGDFVFLIGPSGAGKTTLLRLIIRDILPSSGRVILDTIEIHKMPRRIVHHLRRKVGMIFQDFKILPDRTVYENVSIALEILGRKHSEIKKEVTDALSLVGMVDKMNKFPAQLSAGELQRTSLARAIVMGPKVILADEPTGNLDPENAWRVVNILQEVNKLGTTIIMVTHNMEIVNQLKRRTITLKEGKIVKEEKHSNQKR
ncbi:MAG: cell division ATP-binding protein FtsE [Patescibacteria group bacterium]|nr:cell division ATP-binding protein FtsE [Patescibacteria group bacterium]